MKIVLAIDGSPSSLQARDLVASLHWPEGTQVALVAAYHIPTEWMVEGGAVSPGLYDDLDKAMRQESEATLAEAAKPLAEAGFVTSSLVVADRPADAIVALADEIGAELIVLGSRGRGQLASMLLGSVSAEVADRAATAVLVARAPLVSKLLAATDGSPCWERVPSELAAWGAFRDMPCVALGVAPVASPAFDALVGLYTMGSETVQAQHEELVQHRGYATAAARQLSEAGIPAQAETLTGDPAHQITRRAREIGADLIVTGSRCLHGLDRWLLGSVGRNLLLHAPASVLIMRPRPTSASGSPTA